jgi:hypothetical protein
MYIVDSQWFFTTRRVMPGGIAKAGATGQAEPKERWPGNYQWQWHPLNKVWTFDKGGGQKHTRFGRFVDGRFVTGEICLPLLAACCLLFAATAACCMLPFQMMVCAGNPSTPSPQPAAAVAAIVAAAAAIAGQCLLHMFCLFLHAACCL